MALVIEDGTGVTGADSFVTVAEYEAYVLDYFGETVTANEPAMRRAFGYMRSLNWIDDAFPTFAGTIPQAVLDAQSIFARAEVAEAEGLQPTLTPGQTSVLVGVDSLRWQVTGAGGTDAQRRVVLMALDRLKGLIEPSDVSGYLVRG
jgi:hypothetical protein